MEVEVQRKAIRNIYLRIRNKRVVLTCPFSMSDEEIYSFLENKKAWIEKNLNKERGQKLNYQGGEAFYLFAKPYQLVFQSGRSKFEIRDDQIFLQGSDREKAIEYLYRQLSRQLLKEADIYLERYLVLLTDHHYFRKPELKVRKMKSRWGVCYPKKNTVSLSAYLIHYPKECLEYIIVHELSHFIVPNHSKAFYALVAAYLPEYRTIEKKLR